MVGKTRRVFIVVSVILAVVILSAVGTAVYLLRSDRIYAGVRIAGIDVSGLSRDGAQHRLTGRASELVGKTVMLEAVGRRRSPRLSDLGGTLDASACAGAAYSVGRRDNVLNRLSEIISCRRRGRDLPATYSFDRKALSAYLAEMAREVDRPPVNARISLHEGSVQVLPDRHGVRINSEKSMSSIARAFNSGGVTVPLTVEAIRPAVTAADLRGIDGVIATYHTPTAGSERSRIHNLKTACRAIDACLIRPGEVFSYNKTVGPRLLKNGFLNAPVFIEGEIRRGPGGGVCQVSSTLYNAALLANLKIRERSHHSRPVHYVPAGRDATVEYGLLDLKFENTTDVPVYISAGVESGRVVVRVFGRKQDDRRVEIMTLGRSIVPRRVVERTDESLAPGERVVREEGRSGHRVQVYRVVKQNGQIMSRELISKDYYPPENRAIAVGPPAEPDSPSRP